jgi:short-subunit dehydrogenase
VRLLVVCPGPTESNFFVAAEFPQTFSGGGQNYATAEEVVQDTLKALEKDFSTLVTGGLSNQFIVNLPRFFPRDTIVSLVEKQFKPKK